MTSPRTVHSGATTGGLAIYLSSEECLKDTVITKQRKVLKPNRTVAHTSALNTGLPLQALAHLDTPTKTARDAVGFSGETHDAQVHIVALCASQFPRRCKSTYSYLRERAWLHVRQDNKLLVAVDLIWRILNQSQLHFSQACTAPNCMTVLSAALVQQCQVGTCLQC